MKRLKNNGCFFKQIPYILLLLCICNGCFKNDKKVEKQDNWEINLLIDKWQSDSLGCKKMRSKELAERIIDSLNLEHATKIEFIKIFGNPNIEKKDDGIEFLCYYFNTLCEKDSIIYDSDYCFAEFSFKQNKLIRKNYICQ